MLFNSYGFIFLFLPVTMLGYFLLGRLAGGKSRLANAWLIAASLFFYSYWKLEFLTVLLGSIAVNYALSGGILKYRKHPKGLLSGKLFFLAGVCFNVALLGYFKYMDWFLGMANAALGTDFPLLHLLLPLGISFFTITQLVYLVDCYEGVAKDHDLLDYALFVSFFPHLLAGPILYHKPMMKQFKNEALRRVDWENLARGFSLFLIGLTKKVLIADHFITAVENGYGNPAALTLLDSWLVVLAYFFQLYFDFSGYSDMAVGLARMMNIKIPINFASPYRASNIIDFWQRWHISLTNTITNYLYTPIVMARRNITFAWSVFAVFAAMLIAGVWHGAGWTFVVFGALHGGALALCHIWRHKKYKMPKWAGRVLTLALVLAADVFFRAESIEGACEMLEAMAGLHGTVLSPKDWIPLGNKENLFTYTAVSIFLTACCPNSNEIIEKLRPNKKWLTGLVVLTLVSLYYVGRISEFLYFQF